MTMRRYAILFVSTLVASASFALRGQGPVPSPPILPMILLTQFSDSTETMRETQWTHARLLQVKNQPVELFYSRTTGRLRLLQYMAKLDTGGGFLTPFGYAQVQETTIDGGWDLMEPAEIEGKLTVSFYRRTDGAHMVRVFKAVSPQPGCPPICG